MRSKPCGAQGNAAQMRMVRDPRSHREHQLTAREYVDVLTRQDWRVTHSREMAARIVLMYVECVREGNQ